jgi:recombinational DNA repair protein (RecF pathway)
LELEGRDKRRAFTQTQKNEILYQQDGKCAHCHEKLDLRVVEFDHVEPWAANGRTVTQNGAALCPLHHRIKTHNDRLKKIENTQKSVKPQIPPRMLSKQDLNKFSILQLKQLAKKHNFRLSSNVYTPFIGQTQYIAPTKEQYVDALYGVVFDTELK